MLLGLGGKFYLLRGGPDERVSRIEEGGRKKENDQIYWFCFILLVPSIRTELQDKGAISHLAITQANVRHSGIYTCSVSDSISQSLRLHIIDGKIKQKGSCA